MLSSKCTIHPQAVDFLFEYKRKVSRQFRNVLGLCEVDHAAITFINSKFELLFLSFTPSIEFNLINSGLWRYDDNYCPDFFMQEKGKFWHELYHQDKFSRLANIKQITTGYSTGISIPAKFNDGYIIYSFALKSSDPKDQITLYEKQNELIKMGRYCLNKIEAVLPLHHILNHVSEKKKNNHLKLVINNKDCDEQNY